LLAIFILAGAGSVALLQWPWVRDIVAGGENEQTSQDIAALQKRVTALEARIDMQSELPAAQPAATAAQPTPVNADVAALGDTVKNLQTEVAQLQGQAQKSLAAAFAFWDLRDAVNRGQAFAPQLAALRNAAGGDASVTEPASRLDAYAATGVPSLAQLHDMLLAQEPAATAPPLPETPSLGDRAKSILRNLVSVHPLHDAQFAALENALDAGDAAATAEAFRALPAEAQQHLAAWQEKLTARLEADQALRALQAHFMATGNAS
jgi:hypothetical protein